MTACRNSAYDSVFRVHQPALRFLGNRFHDSIRSPSLPMSSLPETPFDSIENAQDYLHLLLEAVVDARNEIAADLTAAEEAKSERRLEALRLVRYKLETLEQHLRSGSQIGRASCRERVLYTV